MTFIDRKGRLFGIINVFDAFVLLLLIASIAFALKWKRAAEDPSWANLRLLHTRCIGVFRMPSYKADLVKEGDEAVDENGAIVGKIEKILDKKPSEAVVYTSRGGDKVFFSSENSDVRVVADILSFERKGQVYSCVTNLPLQIGSKLAFSSKRYSDRITVREILATEKTE